MYRSIVSKVHYMAILHWESKHLYVQESFTYINAFLKGEAL